MSAKDSARSVVQMERLVEDVVAAVRDMNGLRAVQSFLRRHALGSGRSWDEITSRLRSHLWEGLLKPEDLIELVTALRSRIHKLISVYPVSKEFHAKLWKWATSLKPSEELEKRFPFNLVGEPLEILDTKAQLMATRTNAEGLEVFFTSARVGKRLDEIEIEDISEDVRADYRDADRMYAERIERRQAFDILYIPRDSYQVQIRVDSLASTNRERADEVSDEIERFVLDGTKSGPTAFRALNLFPAIRSIYDDGNAGRLIGLQFDCSTGANRREVMRKVKGTEDLRVEKYHLAGVGEVEIAPYWLVVQLPPSDAAEGAEITLPGTLRNLHKMIPLTTFEVSSFVTETAIENTVSFLAEHVQAE